MMCLETQKNFSQLQAINFGHLEGVPQPYGWGTNNDHHGYENHWTIHWELILQAGSWKMQLFASTPLVGWILVGYSQPTTLMFVKV